MTLKDRDIILQKSNLFGDVQVLLLEGKAGESGAPLVARTAAAMTDTTRIYVYLGSEAGYTNGNWYHYDKATAAWISGGAYGTDFATDSTLEVAGMAADAKAAGDAIRANTASIAENAADITETKQDVSDLKSAVKQVSIVPKLRNGSNGNPSNTYQVAITQIIPFETETAIKIMIKRPVSASGNYYVILLTTFSVASGKPEDNTSRRIIIDQHIDASETYLHKSDFSAATKGFSIAIGEKNSSDVYENLRITDFGQDDVVIVKDYTDFSGIQLQINATNVNVSELRNDFDTALTSNNNYLEGKTPESGYIYSRNTGNKSANQYGVIFEPVPVKSGVTYYYKNIYAYFSVFVTGSTVTPLEPDDSTSSLSGSYTPNADGVIKITKHIDDATDTLFTNSQDLYLSGGFDTYYSANKLDTQFVIHVGADREYTRLRDGITEAIKHKNAIVYVDPGTYDLCSEFASEIAANLSGVQFGNGLGDGIHIIFNAGAKVVANYTGGVRNITTYFNPFYPKGDGCFTLENADISVTNVRYCVHDEWSSHTIKRVVKYINCKMQMDNTTAVINWYPQCIGGGNGSSDYISIENCYFKSKVAETVSVPLVSYHNNNSGTGDMKSDVHVSNCYFADKGTFRCTYSGQATAVSKAYVNNCSLGANPIIGQEQSGGTAPENYELITWMNEIRQ